MIRVVLICLALMPPRLTGDPEVLPLIEAPLQAAVRATESYGTLPDEPWEVVLHPDSAAFEHATHAPPGRAASWEGSMLHLRPWNQLRQRDLGALLRHELVHRRLQSRHLRRWEEEARCLHAETHTAPPSAWPAPPAPLIQNRLDLALQGGITSTQAWAYRALRAWLAGDPVPEPPQPRQPEERPWAEEPQREDLGTVQVRWPPEKVPRHLVINGTALYRGESLTVRNGAVFGPDSPVLHLPGKVTVLPSGDSWAIIWTTEPRTWVAAATAGELGEDTPFEARRALAAVLWNWLAAHPRGNHADGSICPLTHCAVVRGEASASTLAAADSAPQLEPGRIWFCASNGGIALSPSQVWGGGPANAPSAPAASGDPWATWTRTLTPAQVRLLKREVRPGLRPGQLGMQIGASGPFAIESLRLAAGRAFGWTCWPSNGCHGEGLPDGSLLLTGRGLGHNVGLSLANACEQAAKGLMAEEILHDAFQ